MEFDIVFVTYNSSKWVDGCLNSILKSDYDLKKLNLYFYDNGSSDDTVKKLEQYKNKEKFKTYEVISGNKNLGFGVANNKGASLGKSDYIFFLNIDTEVYKDTFSVLESEIKESKDFQVFELRQVPYEHPKYYDPYTGETSWASGACVVFKRDLFMEIGGFDKNLFMYCEDVEISWNARRHGAKIKYLYNAKINHFSYTEPYMFKENQYIYGIVNNLYLRAKHGKLRNFIKGIYLNHKFIKNEIKSGRFSSDKELETHLKKRFRKENFKMFFKASIAFIHNQFLPKNSNFAPKFVLDYDYEVTKLDPFYVQKPDLKKEPLVSILVRTCGRPDTLRETIKSIEKQSYKNIEIVIVEDGEDVSRKMIDKEFSHLNIIYHATKEKVERSKTGNIALRLAHGKYLNFLDDDDLFYPDHVETLVKELESSDKKIAYTTAFETPFVVHSRSPYRYEIKDVAVVHSSPFSKIHLYHRNITPIQAVMFDRCVYKEYGGFDENINACEDWDLWVRYSQKYSFLFILKTTSIYRVPFYKDNSLERQEFLDSCLKYLYKKYETYKPEITIEDIRNF